MKNLIVSIKLELNEFGKVCDITAGLQLHNYKQYSLCNSLTLFNLEQETATALSVRYIAILPSAKLFGILISNVVLDNDS